MGMPALMLWFALSTAPKEPALPWKYVVCPRGQPAACQVEARFVDQESCEYFKRYARALCDDRSSPGKASCTFQGDDYGRTESSCTR